MISREEEEEEKGKESHIDGSKNFFSRDLYRGKFPYSMLSNEINVEIEMKV